MDSPRIVLIQEVERETFVVSTQVALSLDKLIPLSPVSSGILGVDAVYSRQVVLSKSSSKALLSGILGGVEWTEVQGPDSLMLK